MLLLWVALLLLHQHVQALILGNQPVHLLLQIQNQILNLLLLLLILHLQLPLQLSVLLDLLVEILLGLCDLLAQKVVLLRVVCDLFVQVLDFIHWLVLRLLQQVHVKSLELVILLNEALDLAFHIIQELSVVHFLISF